MTYWHHVSMSFLFLIWSFLSQMTSLPLLSLPLTLTPSTTYQMTCPSWMQNALFIFVCFVWLLWYRDSLPHWCFPPLGGSPTWTPSYESLNLPPPRIGYGSQLLWFISLHPLYLPQKWPMMLTLKVRMSLVSHPIYWPPHAMMEETKI